MRLGVVLPQTELGDDTTALRAYALGVQDLGYEHLLAYDHVLGADPACHPGWSGHYDVRTPFREPMVLFGYLAALTSLELVTAVLVLPQRQTALVAKQAAEVDMLTGGRFRLGVGLGWNAVEYEALGQRFTTRARRSAEQVKLLRELWTRPSVNFQGEFDTVTGAGLCPLPRQRPIPIWLGGESDAAYARAGRLADGFFPRADPGPALDHAVRVMTDAAEAAGRDPAEVGIEGRVTWQGSLDRLVEDACGWRAAGATHLSINTMGSGLPSIAAHLDILSRVALALASSRG